jgi:tetratricopeptide (TPR) repeat protein
VELKAAHEEELKDLEAAAAAKPDDPAVHKRLGRAYSATGALQKAREQFEKALELKSDDFAAQVLLAENCLRRGDIRGVMTYTQSLIRLSPESVAPRRIQAAALVIVQRYDQARKLIDEILRDDPNDADTLLELGTLGLAEKKYADAEAPFRRAYTLDPSSLRGLQGLVSIRFDTEQPDKAIEAVAAEVKTDPQSMELRRELAIVEFRAKQYDKARADFEAVLAASPQKPAEQAELLSRIAATYELTGDSVHAIENLKKAVQAAPDNIIFLNRLASTYENAGKKTDAIAGYRAVLKIAPNEALTLNNLAYLVADTGGDLDEALHLAQQARQQLPDVPEVLDTIGWIYLKKDLPDSAARVFEDLLEKHPNSAVFHYHYGLALAKKGDKAAAENELKLALENHPGKLDEAAIREALRKL